MKLMQQHVPFMNKFLIKTSIQILKTKEYKLNALMHIAAHKLSNGSLKYLKKNFSKNNFYML